MVGRTRSKVQKPFHFSRTARPTIAELFGNHSPLVDDDADAPPDVVAVAVEPFGPTVAVAVAVDPPDDDVAVAVAAFGAADVDAEDDPLTGSFSSSSCSTPATTISGAGAGACDRT